MQWRGLAAQRVQTKVRHDTVCGLVGCLFPPLLSGLISGAKYHPIRCSGKFEVTPDLPHAVSPRSLIGHVLSAAVKLNTGVNLRIDFLWRRLPAHGILELWPSSATELQRRYPLRALHGHGCARTVSVGVREKGKYFHAEGEMPDGAGNLCRTCDAFSSWGGDGVTR